ncbi:hypothetical protein CDD83_1627 [Cordyceps sp. RAO-2017]|nr:hypothetical protein CDD83_1627 [Cordyceps sp. RAO-2017]
MRPILLFPLFGSLAFGADDSPAGAPDAGAPDAQERFAALTANPLTCDICQTAVGALRVLADKGDGVFVESVSAFGEICEGLVTLEGPALANRVRKMRPDSVSIRLFCNSFFGACVSPPVEEWKVPFPSEAPPRAARPRRTSGRKPIKFVQYSDLHVDPLYKTGSNAECSNPILCCREDSSGPNETRAGPFGHIRRCDTPFALEESMYRAIEKVAPDAAFTIFTGDIVERALWQTTQPSNQDRIVWAYGNMSRYFDLVYGVVGNHEQSPVNLFPLQEPAPAGQGAQWLYRTLSREWGRWTGRRAAEQARALGHYSVKYPHGNLRIISLNTNYYYRDNFWVYEDPLERDPMGQFAWLVGELDAAERAAENVYIIGHLPMGDQDAFHHTSNYFDQIVRRYAATIAAMFFGHTHVDEFELHYADYAHRSARNALVTSYICPSVTPSDGMPAFRVYEVDPDTFAVLDVVTYRTDMEDAAFQAGPRWTKYYSAKEAYGPAVRPPVRDPRLELTPAFWHGLTEEMDRDQRLFDSYYRRKSRGWNAEPCTGQCKKTEICQLRAGRSQDNCRGDVLGFHFKRDDAGHPPGPQHAHHSCGSTVGTQTLRALKYPHMRAKLLEIVREKTLA